MRVIAGQARGLKLRPPPGDRVRPTLDRVREALFSILTPDLADASFLDLYAGSGANGIEALSRGAASAVFVDSHTQSQVCIRKNLETTKLESRARVMHYGLPENLHKIGGAYDITFADPPYAQGNYTGLLTAIGEARLVAEGGLVIVEHPSWETLPEVAGGLACQRRKRYGKTTLSFYA